MDLISNIKKSGKIFRYSRDFDDEKYNKKLLKKDSKKNLFIIKIKIHLLFVLLSI